MTRLQVIGSNLAHEGHVCCQFSYVCTIFMCKQLLWVCPLLYIPKIYMVSALYMNKDVEATFLEDVLRADGEKVK